MSTNSIFILFFLLLLGCGNTNEPIDAATTSSSTTTAATTISSGPLLERTVEQNIACTGSIHIPPTDLLSIHSLVAGQISDLQYIPGDYVKKGALLARVTHPNLLEKQRLLLETKAALTAAEQSLARQKTLAEGEATTAQDVEISQAKVRSLQATYQGLRKELSQVGIHLSSLEEEMNYQTSVAIYASGSGYVHEVFVNQGQMVEPGMPLLEIADKSHLHLELDVPVRHAATVEKGQKISFSFPGSSLKGTASIVKINPMIDTQTNTLRVHAHIDDEVPSERIIPGLFVEASIRSSSQTVKGLPRDAVLKTGAAYFGFLKTADGYEKIQLEQVVDHGDFVSFSNAPKAEWVTGGAYYLEGVE